MKPISHLSKREKLSLAQASGQGMRTDTAILIYMLEDERLYAVSDMAASRFPRGDHRHKDMVNRLNSFLRYRRIEPDSTTGVKAWYGKTIKEHLDPRYYYMAEVSLNFLSVLDSFRNLREMEQSEVVRMAPPPKRRWLNRKVLGLTAAAALFTMVATGDFNKDVFRVLKQKGIGAAVAHLAQQDTQDAQSLHEEAWLDYRQRDFRKAEAKAHYLLGRKDTEELMQAQCFYLLASIKSFENSHHQALGYFTEAVNIYQEIEQYSGAFSCFTSMAHTHFILEDYDQAEQELANAWNVKEHGALSPEMGRYHQVQALIDIGRGDVDSALKNCHEAVKAFQQENNLEKHADGLSTLGFLYTMKGDMEQGLAYTLEAQSRIVELGDEERNVFNMVNYVFLDRLAGRRPNPYSVETVNQWIERNRNKELEHFLNWALTFKVAP